MLSKLIAETELAGLENPIQEAPVTKEWVRQFELGLLTFSARKGKWTRILKFESPSNEYLPYDFVVWRTKRLQEIEQLDNSAKELSISEMASRINDYVRHVAAFWRLHSDVPVSTYKNPASLCFNWTNCIPNKKARIE